MSQRPRSFLQEAPSMRVLRRATIAALAVVVPVACWSGYRAIWQVKSLELLPPAGPLVDGAEVRVAGESWGRVWVDLHLLLAQGTRAETLGVRRMRTRRTPSVDPRPVSETLHVTLARARLARFDTGSAVLTAAATGRPQFLRTPPPVIRTATVRIGP